MNDFFERISKLSPKRLALLAMELQNRLEKVEGSAAEPIAVVGLGCRFPGHADGLDAYWRVLRDGVDAVREVPPERWDSAIFDSDADAAGLTGSKWGSFLDGVDQFDARFFGISRREAVSLDPQQRMLLEVSWEALEHAGVAPDSLTSSSTGVFVTVGGLDYYHLLLSGGAEALDAYSVSGNAPSMAAGRLSYFLGLQGPALTVDTACSSSLVAVHLACQSLRAGECRMALAGAANLMLSRETSIGLSRARMLSSSGRCRSFDAGADGIVRGEGCGILVLKRLSNACADGDRILAVLRGTAINQDGRSSGITAPNGPAQEAVIKEALHRSGLIPDDIDYIEAHGTGTPLGDPIEVRALANVFDGRPDRLLIGSVKTNFGHLEMAAGIAGLIKVVLALRHGEIPPHLHLTEPSGYIDWDRSPIEVATALRPWARGTRVRRAGVSSFGFSGTNAHVIVEEAPAESAVESEAENPAHILTISARDEKALCRLVELHHKNLIASSDSLSNICFTSNRGRTHFAYRAATVARTREEMAEALADFSSSPPGPRVFRGKAPKGGRAPEVAFLFTGQGSQYVGMAKELCDTQPVFRQTLEDCDQRLQPHLGRSILALIHPIPGTEEEAGTLLTLTTYAQPALFVIEYALAALWRSWGVIPSVVAGHSVGELAAACVAGVLTLDDALRLVAARGRLMGTLPAGGVMVSVFCDEATAIEGIGRDSDAVSIAAVNGPAHVVLSGASTAVDKVVERLAAFGIRTTPLHVSHAFHSELLHPMLNDFEEEASKVTASAPEVTLVSNLTGRVVTSTERLDGRYWREHARNTVRFVDAVRTVCEQGCGVVLEIGPHPVLLALGRECVPAAGVEWLPSLRRGTSDTIQMLTSVARLHAAGTHIDWQGFYAGQAHRKVDVPTYPFQRESYWLAQRPRTAAAPEPWRDWLYSDEWQPLAPGAAAANLGTLEPIGNDQLTSLCEEHSATCYRDLYPALDALCAAYARKALDSLGWSPATHTRFSTAGLRRTLGVTDNHERLFGRLLEILAEDGLLVRTGDLWEAAEIQPVAPDPDTMGAKFLEQLPICRTELTLTMRCGNRLAEVLTGRCDPLELLFPGGSLEIAEDLYVRAPSMRVFNALVARTVASATRTCKAPRLLEIGAGTGATTAAVLPVLPPGARYVFTDVSQAFTGRARATFAGFGNVEYRTLDIEHDPAAQGLSGERFDIVIASNVLHATARLDDTLKHARSMLAPGGLLILVETVGRQRFGDLTVGLTPGWWRFADSGLRPDHALLTQEQWKNTLREAGFEEALTCPDPDLPQAGVFANMTLMAVRSAGQPAPSESSQPRRRSWIVYADRQGIAGRLAEEIRARADECVVIPADAELRLPGQTPAPGAARIVVNCRPLDAGHEADADAAAVMRAAELACGTSLTLAKDLASDPAGTPAGLFALTQGAQQLEQAALSQAAPVQSTVHGLARTAALEHPELEFTSVDLPAGMTGLDVTALVDCLSEEAGAGRDLALRGGTVFARRIVRSSLALKRSGRIHFRTEAAYLVTGGTAGLGLRLAEWLADRGACNLVLAARSAPSASAQSTIEKLRARGVTVVDVRADVSSQAGVEQMLAAVPAGAPLAGIFHLAGSVDDGILLQQDWSRFERVMATKVMGSWMLHRRTASMDLDHFVLFSSGASFLGSAGQSNHAAANAFMDTLSRLRRSQGLPSLSINWGAWTEIGAATRGGVADRARTRGLGAMSPGEALAAFEHVLQSPSDGQIAIMPIEWRTFLSERPHDPALAGFALKSPAPAAITDNSTPAPVEASPTAWLDQVTAARLRPALERAVLGEVARVLALREAEINSSQPLRDAGMDSLMAVELRNCLSRITGAALPAAVLFNYPSVDELVGHLHGLLAARQPAAAEPMAETKAPQGPEPTMRASTLDDLSEEELATLLAGKLRNGGGSRGAYERQS